MSAGSIPKHSCFPFGSWVILSRKGHILQSRCMTPEKCQSPSDTNLVPASEKCTFCCYEEVLNLPQLPEMTFAMNLLSLDHKSGLSIQFEPLEALKQVDSKNDTMKVAVAEAWQESRSDDMKIKDIIKPFDWTYTTHYKGTLTSTTDIQPKVSETDERINMEKLKEKPKILFYEEVMLFEDELADNGTAHCSVKIRVMPDSFFILLRYFLRVDNLLVRIIDTRLFFEEEKNYILREHMTKETKIKDISFPSALLKDPQELWNYLPTVDSVYEKIEL